MPKTQVRECTVLSGLHLVDIREQNKFARGHSPGAVHWGQGGYRTGIVLYCGRG